MKTILINSLCKDKEQWNRVYNVLKYNDFLRYGSVEIIQSPFIKNGKTFLRSRKNFLITQENAKNLLNELEAHLKKKEHLQYKFTAIKEFKEALKEFVS